MPESEAIPLYREGRHYDLLNDDLVADIPFYVEEARRASGPVLEIACGTGRLAIPIAQSGVAITGLDQSPSMLAHARKKAVEAGVNITWVEADCRNFDLRRKFALIFIAFNSMQHLHDQQSLQAFFRNVKHHLAEGGKFIVDVFNPKLSILTRDPQQRFREREYEDPDGRGTIVLEQTATYDDAAQVNRIKWYFSLPGQKDFRVEDLHMRCFFPQELDLLLTANGFAIEEKYGDFEHHRFASGMPKQIVICRAR